ncbi:hypothetical protein [Streptomyces sp. NPDC059479]|uniref:hypothetical protein n=1 Tax=Streptomyces sp. NPDC059479 TaxID=3346848 RepID=UPI0036BB8778
MRQQRAARTRTCPAGRPPAGTLRRRGPRIRRTGPPGPAAKATDAYVRDLV